MKVRLVLLSLLGLVILLGLPAPAGAEGTSCGSETVLVPDGRIVESTIPANTTLWFLIQTTVGRSYSVEIKSKLDQVGTFPGTTTLFNGADACSGTSTLQIRDTTAIEPQMPANGTRVSFTAVDPADTGRHRIRLVNGATNTIPYTISISETTLFNPGWTTVNGGVTFWYFFNTTNATINGVLTVLDTTGTQVAAEGVAIPPNWDVTRFSFDLVAFGLGGTARFTHDGPPGAVLAEGLIARPCGPQCPNSQLVRFHAPRQRR